MTTYKYEPGQAVRARFPMGHPLCSSYNSQVGVILKQTELMGSTLTGESYPGYEVRFVKPGLELLAHLVAEAHLETGPEIDLLVATGGGL